MIINSTEPGEIPSAVTANQQTHYFADIHLFLCKTFIKELCLSKINIDQYMTRDFLKNGNSIGYTIIIVFRERCRL